MAFILLIATTITIFHGFSILYGLDLCTNQEQTGIHIGAPWGTGESVHGEHFDVLKTYMTCEGACITKSSPVARDKEISCDTLSATDKVHEQTGETCSFKKTKLREFKRVSHPGYRAECVRDFADDPFITMVGCEDLTPGSEKTKCSSPCQQDKPDCSKLTIGAFTYDDASTDTDYDNYFGGFWACKDRKSGGLGYQRVCNRKPKASGAEARTQDLDWYYD
eukprot:33373_1